MCRYYKSQYRLYYTSYFVECNYAENPEIVVKELRRICSEILILICPLENPHKWGFNYHVNFYINKDSFVNTVRKDNNLNSKFKTHERIGDIMYVEFIK